MGGSASNKYWLKSTKIKQRILDTLDEHASAIGTVYKIDNYIWLEFTEPKSTSLYEDNKEYKVLVPLKKTLETYEFLLSKGERPTFKMITWGQANYFLKRDFSIIQACRITWRR